MIATDTAQVKTETWTELRCPACVPLGFYSPRLLFRVVGKVEAQAANLEIKCWMCHSVISWRVGTPVIEIKEHGRKNHKRQTAAFE